MGSATRARRIVTGEGSPTLREYVATPDDAYAWAVMAQLAEDQEQALQAVQHVLRLKPGSAWAQQFLARLKQEDEPDDDPIPLWLIGSLAGLVGLLLLAVLVFAGPARRDRLASGGGLLGPALQQVADLPMAECQALIEQALLVSDDNCQRIGRNEVCYGNNTIDAVLAADADDEFQDRGDVIPVQALQALTASPLNLIDEEWGVAVFKLQATLPRTVPGQNVTFLLFGNTSLENTSGDMQAIYFSTGFGTITCDAVPFDGILVRTPDGGGITFQANGTSFTLDGNTATILEAQPGGEMTVSVLDGQAVVTADGQEQPVAGGNRVKIPLGGEDGLNAVGPPSGPEALPGGPGLGCTLLGLNCPSTPTPGPEIAAGLPTNSFYFAGFLAAKQKARCGQLLELSGYGCTVVLFESTHRIMDLLDDIITQLGADQRLHIRRS